MSNTFKSAKNIKGKNVESEQYETKPKIKNANNSKISKI